MGGGGLVKGVVRLGVVVWTVREGAGGGGAGGGGGEGRGGGGGGANKRKHFETGQNHHCFIFYLNNYVFKKSKTIRYKI